MIIEEVVLHHFGSYYGRQTVSLDPMPDRPVVLIGGLNGVGKTTLLDALQLALYGKLAQCSNRGTLAYEEFLRRAIHRSVDPAVGAAIELQFRHTVDGKEHSFRIHRHWRLRGNNIKEQVEVTCDGKLDRVLTETWDEHVEAFLPRRISPLFFFDGEKIEGFADPQKASDLLATAVQSLLGIDLVEQLDTDLVVLQRRKRTELRDESSRREFEQMRAELEQLASTRGDRRAERAAAGNVVDRAEKQLLELEERFRLEGGELFQQRSQLEADRAAVIFQLDQAHHQLRELASSSTPLILVPDLLQAVEEQIQREREAGRQAILCRELSERDEKLVIEARSSNATDEVLTAIEGFLLRDREARASAVQVPLYLEVPSGDGDRLRQLRETELLLLQGNTSRVLATAERLRAQLADLDRKLARVPDHDAIASLVEERERARTRGEEARQHYNALTEEIERLDREYELKQSRLTSRLERQVEADFAHDADERVVAHSEKVRGTLQTFRTAVVSHHIQRIERLILESFQQLLRKQSFITDLRIDPVTFAVETYGPDGQILSPDRLSAGERQLLAVSMLWGLARASGRALPVVIDTPLGRLDSAHRTHLVERYFPAASHQVLLLSTDEEIRQEYLEKLTPFVGKAYHLVFDESAGATRFEHGYFPEGVTSDVA